MPARKSWTPEWSLAPCSVALPVTRPTVCGWARESSRLAAFPERTCTAPEARAYPARSATTVYSPAGTPERVKLPLASV